MLPYQGIRPRANDRQGVLPPGSVHSPVMIKRHVVFREFQCHNRSVASLRTKLRRVPVYIADCVALIVEIGGLITVSLSFWIRFRFALGSSILCKIFGSKWDNYKLVRIN